MKKTKIIIAGGGFAGLYAAKCLDKKLARRPDIEVTLISRENFILFTPMLHEVAAGDLSPSDIVNPLRRILRHVNVVQAEIQAIDLTTKKIRCLAGVRDMELEFEFDHLLLTMGSETNFFDMQGVRDWAVTMKSLSDTTLLRNRMVALLEEASLQKDEATRRELLTFVTAGGGFAGVETTGAVNDFVRETVKFYPSLREQMIRVVVVHPGKFLLPELGEELGRYAEQKLSKRNVEIIKGVRVAGYDGSVVKLTDGKSIPASTLIWTAGVKPSPVIAQLPCQKEHGRLLVSEYLAVTGVPGLWAAGDCAAVPILHTETFHPPTAQHGLRQGVVAAKNIAAVVLDRPLQSFRFTTLGQLATIGRRTGVAMVFGFKFSGLIAWGMWRSIYLMKLPRLAKKLRVMMDWTLDLLFGRDIEQMVTLRDIEAVADQIARIRASAKQSLPVTETAGLRSSTQPTLTGARKDELC
ncbi:MAG TPA: NAD(P)/FAD-dependent oxidoreductase [Chthoniobacterales bacterium]|jgi:NADH dehydrogenase|nr:NAD(P)/FAD-dependent oxidoreductase [Chthoniobacterales bacterium]